MEPDIKLDEHQKKAVVKVLSITERLCRKDIMSRGEEMRLYAGRRLILERLGICDDGKAEQ